MAGSSTSWSKETDEKINYTKLCRLLVNGGTQAVRSVFDGIHPPSSLKATLNTYQVTLQKLKKPKGKVLNNEQWDKLYPPSGSNPTSEDFDITLLFVLLRNVCGLTPPATGWDVLPPVTDNSLEANLVRIKFYRNNTIAHKPNTEINDVDFEQHWQDISSALLSLGLSQDDIDDLKSAPLGEKDYNQLLDDWYMSDEDIKTQLEDIKSNTEAIKSDTANIKSVTADIKTDIKSGTSDIREKLDDIRNVCIEAHKMDQLIHKLAISDFRAEISKKCKSFHPNTRKWILDQVKSYVDNDQPDSCIMLITAGPGMGKSTLAAKICQTYKDLGCLAACHFFQFSNSTRDNPRLMLQSIARQMCYTVPGYREALESKLRTDFGIKKISNMNCEELFTVLLEEPLPQKLEANEQPAFVVVLDAIDECCSKHKHELQDVLKNKLSLLPSWLRFVITTRPPPSFNALTTERNIVIDPKGSENQHDIEIFFKGKVKDIDNQSRNVGQLVEVSGGLFLVANFLIDEMKISSSELKDIFPRGLSSIYEKYLERLKTVLLPFIMKEEGIFKMLEAVVASKDPIPKEMIYSILGLKSSSEIPHAQRKSRTDALSQLHLFFPVENDHVNVFHKSLFDFLILEEKEDDFNIPAKKMRQNAMENLPDEVESLQGAVSQVPDSSDHIATQNQKEDKKISLPTICTEELPKNHDFSVRVNDGNKVLVGQCYEVLSGIMKGNIDLSEPLDLTDEEKYALKFVWEFLKSGSNDSKFFNYFLISALLCYCQYEDNTIQSETSYSNSNENNPFLNIFKTCAQFFVVRTNHKTWCPFAEPPNFGRYVEFVLQTANNKKMDQETPPKAALELLQREKLSYCEITKVIDTQQERQNEQSPVSILGCRDGFVFVQEGKLKTVFLKYRQDGAIDVQNSFPGWKNACVSPNHDFIVVTEKWRKDDIEIIDASTLGPVKSIQSPNIIRSCHVFGDQPWYIVARCYNNKIYVIEVETGAIVSTIDGIGQHVEVEGVSHLGHILLGTSHRYQKNSLFTDEDGNFLEEMTWSRELLKPPVSSFRTYQRKLFLCHYENPEEKLPIYPTLTRRCRCVLNQFHVYNVTPGYGESVGFSHDGSLLAFHYKGAIVIRNTRDCSLYRRVELGPHDFFIHDEEGILLLTKDYVVVCDRRRFNNYFVILVINLHTNEIEHIYHSCIPRLKILVLPKATDGPFTFITDCYSENKRYQLQRYTLHNLNL